MDQQDIDFTEDVELDWTMQQQQDISSFAPAKVEDNGDDVHSDGIYSDLNSEDWLSSASDSGQPPETAPEPEIAGQCEEDKSKYEYTSTSWRLYPIDLSAPSTSTERLRTAQVEDANTDTNGTNNSNENAVANSTAKVRPIVEIKTGTKRPAEHAANTIAVRRCLSKHKKIDYTLNILHNKLPIIERAIALWEQKQIQYKINKFFQSEQIFNERKEWEKITKDVINSIDSNYQIQCKISKFLTNVNSNDYETNREEWGTINTEVLKIIEESRVHIELINYISSIGGTILNWYRFIVNKLKCNITVVQKIHWTNGVIDKAKTFKSFLETELDIRNKQFITRLFELSCMFCVSDDIRFLFERIPIEIRSDVEYNYGHHLQTYWKCCILENSSDYHKIIGDKRNDTEDIYNTEYSPEENMFKVCVLQGYDVAAKFFYHTLNAVEKNRNLHNMALLILKKCTSNEVSDYMKGCYADILLFLLSEMTLEVQHEVIKLNTSTILEMLFSYPWSDYYLITLNEMWDYFTDNAFEILIYNILTKLTTKFELCGYNRENGLSNLILRSVWKMSPVKFKHSIHTTLIYNYCNMLITLLKIEDITTISLIINDPDMLIKRSHLIDLLIYEFCLCIKKENHKIIERFLKEVLVSEIERHCFEDNVVKNLYVFLEKSDYDTATRILHWRYGSLEDRKAFLMTNDSPCKFILEQWNKVNGVYLLESTKTNCDQYLFWLLNSPEEVDKYKRSLITNRRTWEFIGNCFDSKSLEYVEYLLWCKATPYEINEMRDKVKFNVAKTFCVSNLILDNLKEIKDYIDKVFDAVESRLFFSEFILSKSGMDACSKFIRYCAEKYGTNDKQKLNRYKMFMRLTCPSIEIKCAFKREFPQFLKRNKCIDEDHKMFLSYLRRCSVAY